jgi:hypothetical protein
MQWKWQTIVMGSAFLAILLLTRQIVSSTSSPCTGFHFHLIIITIPIKEQRPFFYKKFLLRLNNYELLLVVS